MFTGLHVKEKKIYPGIKLHENPSSGSRVVPCELWTDGWTDGQTDRHTNITKLIVTFRNFPNALKSGVIERNCVVYSYISKNAYRKCRSKFTRTFRCNLFQLCS